MQFSYKWLGQFFEGDLPEIKVLQDKLSLHSFELEGVEKKEDDVLIDLDILPNRSSDCMSYKGIAQEISALFGLKIKDNIFKNPDGKAGLDTSDFVDLTIEATEVIRATKRIALNVKVQQSPQWLKDILSSIGQKSINNVVDITNYVMWMTGQPVHAFDFDKISGGDKKEIKIRYAERGENIVDLSGDSHELDQTMLVIADNEKALDIAGIKGGQDTGVDENTKTVLMSAVNFDFQNIRNTSRKLKLRTDASIRYENQVPLCRLDDAMALFSRLLEELASASVAEKIIDTNPSDLGFRKEIKISVEKINSILGTNMDSQIIQNIFQSLRLETQITGDDFVVHIPCDRLDLNIPEDLIEEAGRVVGYDNLPDEMPKEEMFFPVISEFKTSYYKVLDLLVSLGFFEIHSRILSSNGVIELQNPYTSELSFVRDNLLDKLKGKAIRELINLDEPKLFEIGKIFTDYKTDDKNKIVGEHWSFAGIIGKRKIKEKQKEDLFYKTKGYLEKIFEVLSIKNITWKDSQDSDFMAEVYVNDVLLGFVSVNFWELDFEKMIDNIDQKVEYNLVSKYPKISRDIAFWAKLTDKKSEVEKIIKDVLPPEATKLELFDIYKDVENNRKSFAFKIDFQSSSETLSDDFANTSIEKVYNALKDASFETR